MVSWRRLLKPDLQLGQVLVGELYAADPAGVGPARVRGAGGGARRAADCRPLVRRRGDRAVRRRAHRQTVVRAVERCDGRRSDQRSAAEVGAVVLEPQTVRCQAAHAGWNPQPAESFTVLTAGPSPGNRAAASMTTIVDSLHEVAMQTKTLFPHPVARDAIACCRAAVGAERCVRRRGPSSNHGCASLHQRADLRTAATVTAACSKRMLDGVNASADQRSRIHGDHEVGDDRPARATPSFARHARTD